MKIGIIAPNFYSMPHPTVRDGTVIISDLAKSLDNLRHEVTFFAPTGSYCPPHGQQLDTECTFGKSGNDIYLYEQECFDKYYKILFGQDIIHDFSIQKTVSDNLIIRNKKNIVMTYLGGDWRFPSFPLNVCVWSKAMRNRALMGVTDYWQTSTPDLGGPAVMPFKEAKVVYGGIDTQFYTPTYEKKDYFLWLNRWNEIKGFRHAIEIAIRSKCNLLLVSEHPDNEQFEYPKKCIKEAIDLIKGHSNIDIKFLPFKDGHHEKKIEYYQQAKALLYPVQSQEPFGLSQVESLACGTPVIGTNYGSIPEVITDGLTGFVCDNKPNSFIEAIQKINKIKYTTCRNEAVRRFDISVMAKNYCSIYKKVIEGATW